VRLLSRREHAAHELLGKLAQRGFRRDDAEQEIDRLAAAGLQSDTRFAEQFTWQRVERGDGPLKIRAALGERGVSEDLIEQVLEPYEPEWVERAEAVARRRFGATAPASWSERARRARFLQQRGFPVVTVRRVTAFDETDGGE